MSFKGVLATKLLFLFIFIGAVSFSTALINIETDKTIRVITLSSNITNFTELQDTPGSYSGQATLCTAVNAGETALEFVTCGSGAGDITDVFGDIWITNGSDTGFVTLIFNETNLNQTIDLRPSPTTNIFDQELNTTFNVVFASVNATNNLTTQNYCNATECHTIEDFLVDTGGATLNIFDQFLNTSGNVTFDNLNVSQQIRANDWTNVTITESQISDLAHTNVTVNIFDQELNTTFNVVFASVNATNNLTTQRYCNATECHLIEDFLVDTGGATLNIFDQTVNTTSNVTFNIVNVSINITATYFIGNGSQLEGIVHTVDSWIANLSSGVTADLFPLTDSLFDFGTTSLRWLTGFFDFIVVTELNATSINVTNNITATYFIGNGSELTSIIHTPTTNIAYLNNTQVFTAPQNFTANVSVSGNITVLDRVCFTETCDKYIFYNGTSMIIQG